MLVACHRLIMTLKINTIVYVDLVHIYRAKITCLISCLGHTSYRMCRRGDLPPEKIVSGEVRLTLSSVRFCFVL